MPDAEDRYGGLESGSGVCGLCGGHGEFPAGHAVSNFGDDGVVSPGAASCFSGRHAGHGVQMYQ